MEETVILVENITKTYRLGMIGGGSLARDFQSWWARVRKQEDPNKVIGEAGVGSKEVFCALDGIHLEVRRGDALGIIGHNGAGKSTLLKLLSRVTAPTEGSIYIKGRIASMLEVGTGFHGELSGRDNIYLNGAILGMTKAEVDAKIKDIIEFSECGEFIDTPVKRYSSGMYVKLAFSVAAHLDSEILIMDEVLAVGDMAFQKKCLNKMKAISDTDKRTILYVSHNMSTIRQMCNRCIVLDHGRIVYDGDPEEAIRVYLNDISDALSDYKNLADSQRGKDVNLWATMTSVELLNTEGGQLEQGKCLQFRLEWHSNRNLKGLHLMATLNDGSSCLGSAVSGVMQETQEEEDAFAEMTLPTDMLVPGMYYVTLLLYQSGAAGSHNRVDYIPLAFSFQVNEIWMENAILWNKSAYGSFRLHDIEFGRAGKVGDE